MKITDPYSPAPRAKASAKPVASAGAIVGQDHARKCLKTRRAKRQRSFLDLARGFGEHRLDRADDERQADEGQSDHHAHGPVGDWETGRLEQAADDPGVGVEGG